ncbi:hypothetical protein Ani05nite_78660 [Amorphoplanes nipponensis]|uniref:Thioredoxin domain-containing protein n=1 Tax=Actinoplanes nipponensis TaxID=135950 RepID=A0A919JRY5_9ACTN|nr:hypothetical protein Ani05nite_78660 [Actinoplanes nipponensis]
MDSTGLIVVTVVLVLGTVAGLWRRRVDGRLLSAGVPAGGAGRPVGGAGFDGPASGGSASSGPASSGPASSGPASSGPTSRGPGLSGDPSAAGQRIEPDLLARLGVEPAPATLLQFSSAFCAPCRAVRRVSAEVAGLLPGVRHVEVDAESHLDAVRALGIWRTPTLLVLDSTGRVVKRATGVPGKAQLIAVLGDLLPAA